MKITTRREALFGHLRIAGPYVYVFGTRSLCVASRYTAGAGL